MKIKKSIFISLIMFMTNVLSEDYYGTISISSQEFPIYRKTNFLNLCCKKTLYVSCVFKYDNDKPINKVLPLASFQNEDKTFLIPGDKITIRFDSDTYIFTLNSSFKKIKKYYLKLLSYEKISLYRKLREFFLLRKEPNN